jgi:cytochrome c-type biogenesis protein CcmH
MKQKPLSFPRLLLVLALASLPLLAESFTGFFPTRLALAQQPTPGAGEPVAIESITDDQVNAIAKQMFCPVCENTPLDVCPTQACAQWRELIREKLAAGWGEQQIKDFFVEQYGARVLAAPPAQGFNWLIYVVPPLAILIGVYILFRALRSWKVQPASQPAAAAQPPPADDEYARRLEEELRKR